MNTFMQISVIILSQVMFFAPSGAFGKWENRRDLESRDEILGDKNLDRTKSHTVKSASYISHQVTDNPSVTVPELGTAKGVKLSSLNGKPFYSFKSIPYAKPPIGKLRFQMPVAYKGKWPTDLDDNSYDATYFRDTCPQSSFITNSSSGSEDCLHLSIYTPESFCASKLLPVMFFIHGGSFIEGSANLYVPTKLMDKEVVVVTVQYRLGSLGFLAAEIPDNPGNMGLMDQITALRWVHKYISYFGGDSNLVTVFGQSAGSASASWMQFSPATTAERNNGVQLLHRLITQSGSALDVWAHETDSKTSFETHAKAVNCWDDGKRDSVSKALECMRKKSVDEIVQGFMKIYNDEQHSGGLGCKAASPVIQKNLLKNYNSEIEKNPDLLVIAEGAFELLKNGDFLKIPVMAGAVRDEGSVFMGYVYEDFLIPNGYLDDEIYLSHMFIPSLIKDAGINDTENIVKNSFKLAFFNNIPLGNFTEMCGGLIDLVGLLFIKSGVWQMAHLQSVKNQQNGFYFYSFEFESEDSLFHWFFMNSEDLPIEPGVAHGDDLIYQFALPGLLDEKQKKTADRLSTLWVNFAKFGDPTPNGNINDNNGDIFIPKWTPFNIKDMNYMLMTQDFVMKEDFSARWNYNSKP